jgi:hypothetical protein
MYKKFVHLSKKRAYSKSPIQVRAGINENSSLSPFNLTPIPGCKSELQSLMKKSLMYEKEEKVLRSRMSFVSVDHEIELSNLNKDLKLKYENLLKENKRLSLLQVSSPQLKQAETEESLFREIQILRTNIKSAEKILEETDFKLKIASEKLKDLEKLHEALLSSLPSSKSPSKNHPNLSDLQKKLKSSEILSKSTKSRLENKLREKENELKSLQDEEVHLRSKLFKQDQQKRLLQISENDYTIRKTMKIRHISPDIRHPDINFLYKPSIKALYNT